MKAGKCSQVNAISVQCPSCGGNCASKINGSLTMISQEDATVVCIDCGEECKVPQAPFTVAQHKEFRQ